MRCGDGDDEEEEGEKVVSARHDGALYVSSLLSNITLSSTAHRPSSNHPAFLPFVTAPGLPRLNILSYIHKIILFVFESPGILSLFRGLGRFV